MICPKFAAGLVPGSIFYSAIFSESVEYKSSISGTSGYFILICFRSEFVSSKPFWDSFYGWLKRFLSLEEYKKTAEGGKLAKDVQTVASQAQGY